MRNSLLIVSFVFISFSLSAQDWQKDVGDEWYNEHVDSMLKIGDTVPKIPLGTVSNNYTGKTNLSDFKGKLVILDFWSKNCSSCIAFFPHMEALQKKFGNQIQIFLVNEWETQEEVDEWFNKIYTQRNRKIPYIPNLPIIFGPREDLQKLFPLRGVPHHVWIDNNSIVRQSGAYLITYEEKIKDLLEGKKIFTMNDENTKPGLSQDKPFYKVIAQSSSVPLMSSSSIITPYNEQLSPLVGTKYENVFDSTNKSIRNTYVNQDVLSLYYNACKSVLDRNKNKLISSANSLNSAFYLDYFLLHVKDTLNYTSMFAQIKNPLDITDQNYVKSKYCYEEITPLKLLEKRSEHMLENLNNYFDNRLGINGKLEKHKIVCYVLVRTSKQDKLSTKNKKVQYKYFTEKGKKWMDIKYESLENILGSFCSTISKSIKNDRPLFFFDETGYTRRVDMILPAPEEISNIEDLRAVLRPYDLDIIQAEREWNFLVIREKGYQNKDRIGLSLK